MISGYYVHCSMHFRSFVDSLLNLDNLLIQIKQDATQVWYQLGEALGIEKKILEKFTTYSPEESIIEMFDYWLRNHSGKPTWKEIAEALRKIRLHKLASGIEMIYKTGILNYTKYCVQQLFAMLQPENA